MHICAKAKLICARLKQGLHHISVLYIGVNSIIIIPYRFWYHSIQCGSNTCYKFRFNDKSILFNSVYFNVICSIVFCEMIRIGNAIRLYVTGGMFDGTGPLA